MWGGGCEHTHNTSTLMLSVISVQHYKQHWTQNTLRRLSQGLFNFWGENVPFWTWCSSSLCYFPFAWLADTACWFWLPHSLYPVGTVSHGSGHTGSCRLPPTAPALTLCLSTAIGRCKLLFMLNCWTANKVFCFFYLNDIKKRQEKEVCN